MRIRAVVHHIPLEFETAPALFSPNHVDAGSCLLLSQVGFDPADKILDLGCGYGLLGIYAAKHLSPDNVYLLDIDPLAVELAATNSRINNVPGVHVERSDGRTQMLGHLACVDVHAGDVFVIETPGGGGYGTTST